MPKTLRVQGKSIDSYYLWFTASLTLSLYLTHTLSLSVVSGGGSGERGRSSGRVRKSLEAVPSTPVGSVDTSLPLDNAAGIYTATNLYTKSFIMMRPML